MARQQLVDTSPPVVSLRIVNLLIGLQWAPPGGLEVPEEVPGE